MLCAPGEDLRRFVNQAKPVDDRQLEGAKGLSPLIGGNLTQFLEAGLMRRDTCPGSEYLGLFLGLFTVRQRPGAVSTLCDRAGEKPSGERRSHEHLHRHASGG